MVFLAEKGYIRTVEAVIAMLLVFAVIVYTAPKVFVDESEMPQTLDTAFEAIFDELSYNETIREDILSIPSEIIGNEGEVATATEAVKLKVKPIIEGKIPGSFDFDFIITRNFEDTLIDWPIDKTIYVRDMMISSNIEVVSHPIIVRIYVWRK